MQLGSVLPIACFQGRATQLPGCASCPPRSRYYVQSLLNLDEQALHSAWSKVGLEPGKSAARVPAAP